MVKACAVYACPNEVTYRGRCQRHASQVDQTRSLGSDRQLGKKLYATAKWKNLRRYLLVRCPICTCAECTRTGRVRAAEVVHHLQPHGGDPVKFYDVAQLQALSKRCHDRVTGRARGGSFAGNGELPETAPPCRTRNSGF